jgi:glycosyltransferase involved in cell wall biosynthesis
LRILYIVTSLGVGGAERQTISLAESMASRGHVVALLSLKHAEQELPFTLPAMRLNMRKTPVGLWRALGFARNFVTLFRADILHSHTFPGNIFARLLRLFMKRDGMATVVINTIHNVYEGGWHRKLIYRVTASLADCITAVSEAAAKAHVGWSSGLPKEIRVIHNGVDTDFYGPDPVRRTRTRALMGAGEHFLWLAVGRIVRAKDYPNLLRAWSEVRREHPAARLWIAGEGQPDELTEGILLSGEADGLGVEWLGLRRDVADLFDAADGYVLSSAWEGMPLAVAEAMAMKKPVVATDAGGVREVLADTGLLVPTGDSAALAEAMLAVMSMHRRQRAALGERARERVLRCFSMEAASSKWEELYTEFVGPMEL